MSYLAPQNYAPTTVLVAPTTTTVAYFDTRFDEILTVQVENLDATQTFAGTIQRRLDAGNGWAVSDASDYFATVGPLGAVVADLDARGTSELRLVGTMSGAGGNVRVTARRRAAR